MSALVAGQSSGHQCVDNLLRVRTVMKTWSRILVVAAASSVLLAASSHSLGAAAVIASQPDTAAEYATEFDALPDDKWFGADNTQSVVLPDGRILWIFADTLKSPGIPWDHNSFVVQSTSGDFTVISQPIANLASGEYIWPSKPVVQGAYLYITASKVKANPATPETPWQVTGTTIEVFSAATLKWLYRTNVPTTRGITWSAGLYSATGYHYVWGSKLNFLGHDAYIARVPKSVAFTDMSFWRYWNGTAWVAQESAAAPNALRGEFDAGWDVIAMPSGGYGLITKSNSFIGKTVDLYVNGTLQNPWVKKKTLVTETLLGGGHKTYAASVHKWAHLASGKMLISLNNGADLNTMYADPRTCRPTFYEVTL